MSAPTESTRVTCSDRAHRVVTLLVASVALVLIGMALTSDARASLGRVLTGTFGGASSSTVSPYPLSTVDACQDGQQHCQKRVAVDTITGDIFVTDPNNHRVEKFSGKTGSLILMFGKDVNKTKVEEVGTTEAERNVCTIVSGDTCQRGTEGTGPGAFVGKMLAVAVDSASKSESKDDVYVANTVRNPNEAVKGEGAGEGIVTKFNEDGEVVSAWGVGGQLHGTGQAFGAFGGITVDSGGNLWVYGSTEREEFSSGAQRFKPNPFIFELNQGGSLVTSWRPSQDANLGMGGIALDEEHHVFLEVEIFSSGAGINKYEEASGNLLHRFIEDGKYLGADIEAHTIDVLKNVRHEQIELPEEIVSIRSSCLELGFEGCSPVETLDPNRPHRWGPFAVNYSSPSDTIYVVEQSREVAAEGIATVPNVKSLPAVPSGTSAATLKGLVDPEGVAVTKCFFEWGEGAGPYEHEAPCEAPTAGEVGAGNAYVPVHAQIAIQAGHAYHYRLVAANANDVAEPVVGEGILLGPPRIDSTSITEITSSSASFQAEVNPRNLATRYHFEYLTEAAYLANGDSFDGPESPISVPLPFAELVPGQKEQSVSAHVTGLSLHTAYRYRIVAENPLGEGAGASTGPAESFRTWSTGAFSLADGRGWEMVSPSDKHGALVEPIGEDWIIQAAAGGGRLAYVTRAPSESAPTGYLVYQSSLATRTSEGWASRNLGVPHTTASEISVGEGWEYRIFSEDLSRAIIQPFGAFVPCTSGLGRPQPCLSPQATEQTAFLASNYAEGAPDQPCRERCNTPLVTGAEGVADVSPETVFGQLSVQGKACPPNTYCGPKFLYATVDLRHEVLESYAALTPSSAPKTSVPHDSLYEWSDGVAPSEQLHLVSVLPGNSSREAPPAQNPQLGFFDNSTRHAISPDGSRVVFTSGSHIYLREHANQPQSPVGAGGECLVASDACTVELDGGLPGLAQFQTANAEVTHIFFTDGTTVNEKEYDLYEYDVGRHKLVRMTSGANVLESVIGASEDGSRIYFVANGALAPHAVSGQCAVVAGVRGCNLYTMHYDGTSWEAPRLVAVLSREDVTDWSSVVMGYGGLAARVSPNGEWLAFMSRRRLTGYNNQDAVSNEPDAEVYEYSAAAGTLVCASCNPTGARPHGKSAEQIDTSVGGLAGGHEVFLGWIAANLPGWTPSLAVASAIYQSRYLSDSGRLFFNSADALVAKDTNGTEDVYEYEPEGVPSGEHACSAGAESGGLTFESSRSLQVEGVEVNEGAGCVGLISSGESSNESAFLDASETGSEVFFMTSARLSGRDTDTSYDVYDAHECTAAMPCLSVSATTTPPCEEESSCKAATSPLPDIFGPSGSATFSGAGNLVQPLQAPVSKAATKAKLLARALKACRKGKARKKRAACERKARRRYGAKQASATGPVKRVLESCRRKPSSHSRAACEAKVRRRYEEAVHGAASRAGSKQP